jgi:hypothetical protein
MTRPLAAAVAVVIALAGCLNAPAPTPGATCPAVRAEGTASDGAALVCDEHGRWRRARFEGGSG